MFLFTGMKYPCTCVELSFVALITWVGDRHWKFITFLPDHVFKRHTVFCRAYIVNSAG